ncbi:MAG: 3-5 exonuclease, partial [Francisellaceae bacterium]|nr:3-5 exonuclease [Francisellaceae bacterium]
GEKDNNYKWNNYINRYHFRHIDLMDVLSSYNNRAITSLETIAILLGLPGKMGMSGAQVYQSYCEKDLKSIRHYCETDVLNTYLVYLRFELMRGNLNVETHEIECEKLKAQLKLSSKPHFHEFLRHWEK